MKRLLLFLYLCFFVNYHLSAQSEVTVCYWFDYDKVTHTETLTSKSCQIDLDVSYLPNQLHTVHIQIKDERQMWSSVVTRYFMKTPKATTMFFWFDQDKTRQVSQNINGLNSNTSSTFDLDASNLPDGLHQLSYETIDEFGNPLKSGASMFIKIPVGGSGIYKYEYWLNSDEENKKVINIDDPDSPFSLMSELDISDFETSFLDSEFRIDNGHPIVFPKYDLNVRFYNAWGFQQDTTCVFVDRYRAKVIDAIKLTPNVQCDLDTVELSKAYWFEFKAQEGDSLVFRARRSCSMTFYNQDAEEVYSVSGENVCGYSGFKAHASGTYYLKVDNIIKSTAIFSLKFYYVSGPSTENPNVTPDEDLTTYEGILIDWETSSEWVKTNNSASLNKEGFRIVAENNSAHTPPYVADVANDLRLYSGTRIQVSHERFIDKLIFCLSKRGKLHIGQIDATVGTVEIDTLKNIVIWKGPSHSVDFTVKNAPNTDNIGNDWPSLFAFNKIYATLLDVDNNLFAELEESLSSNSDYTGYNNIIFLYRDGSQVSYSLNDDIKVTFTKNVITVSSNKAEVSCELNSIVRITYSNDDHVGIEAINTHESNTNYFNGELILKSLPINSYLRIYTIDGKSLVNIIGLSGDYTYSLSTLNKGVYVVDVNGVTNKIFVK